MFNEEDNNQNGNQSRDLATRIANMFLAPQARGQNDGDGDFVNRNIALRVDPATGTAYRVRPGQSATPTNASTQQQSYMPPIQTRDAQGKTLPKYRMGIGHRILATVANFANGFAGNGATPVYVGPGALNNRYYQDAAFRQQQNEENGQNARDLYLKAVDWKTIAQDPVTKKWYGKSYGGQKQEIGAPPWTAPEDDANDDADNNDGNGLPPVGTQVGAANSRASQRFKHIRKSRDLNSYR